MVGDMFNTDIKAKLKAICADLAAYLIEAAPSDESPQHHEDNCASR